MCIETKNSKRLEKVPLRRTIMIYKGLSFRRNKKIVTLPKAMNFADDDCIVFGRVCGSLEKGAVKTQWLYESGSPVYAKAIPIEAYTRSNLCYGKDGRAYLFHAGECFMANTEASSLEFYNESRCAS